MIVRALVGSIRENSYNEMLVNTIQIRHKEKFEVELLDLALLPYFNQDLEYTPPTSVVEFKRKISSADAIFIASPEYNWSVPGILKNALDWLSRGDKALVDKPVLCMGASTGMVGTVRAQIHLRQMLSSPGLSCKMLPAGGNEILVPFVDKKMNDDHLIADEPTLLFIDSIIEKFVDLIAKSSDNGA